MKKTICRAAKTYILDVTLVTGKERDMFKENILVHSRVGWRLALITGLCEDAILQARAARLGHLALLRSPFLPIFGGSPFLTLGGRDLDFSFTFVFGRRNFDSPGRSA